MKVLSKKLKKVHTVKKIFYFLTIVIYLATYILFVKSLLKLTGIENLIRIIIIVFFGLWFFIYLLSGLVAMIKKSNKTFIFVTIISLLFSPIFGYATYHINKVYGSLSNINSDVITYTTNLIALKDSKFSNDVTIGMIEAEDDVEGNILAKKLIKEQSLSNKIETYEDYHSMIVDLYKGKIGGCFVSSNYAVQFGQESFEDLPEGQEPTPIDEKVKVVFSYSEDRKNEDDAVLNTSKKKKTLTEPFTVLVMGVDSAINGLKANQAFNGDTLILVTFNPNTLSATMFSIPRDMYVPIACNHDRYAKINSSAAYGSKCVINTVQQLTDIDIDYYVKINFTGVVDLVEALGGVYVNVEEPDFQINSKYDCKGTICEQNSLRQFGDNMVYVPIGWQTLNGEQALAYARNRHQFAQSDIARNQHQQQVIEAMAKKLKDIKSINDFENVLNTVSNNIETNMTPEQIMSFYNVGKDMLANTTTNSLSIKKTYLAYYSLPVYLPRSGMYTSALGYYPQSLEAITKLMRVNLGLEKEEVVKTFDISYNENYETPITGYGLTGGAKLERVKGFLGNNISEAIAWAQMNGLNYHSEIITDAAAYGTVVNQSRHEGELLKSISDITFYYSNGTGATSLLDDYVPAVEPEEPEIPTIPTNPGTETPTNPTNPETPNENNDKPNDDPVIPGGPGDKPPTTDKPNNNENNSGENKNDKENESGDNSEKKDPIDQIVPKPAE